MQISNENSGISSLARQNILEKANQAFSGGERAEDFSKKNPEIYKKIYSILEKNNHENFLKCYEIFVNYIDNNNMLKNALNNLKYRENGDKHDENQYLNLIEDILNDSKDEETINNIYVSKLIESALYFNQELFDIALIEIVKGPQGALYGKNAIAGAINIVTNQPTNKFKSKAKLLSEDQILHVRTAGTTKYREYITKKGIKYITKPYNFTLDYNVITRLLKPII